MKPSVTAASAIPERRGRRPGWRAVPAPRRLLITSVAAIALLLMSVLIAVWYAVSSVDAASSAAEQDRAKAALFAVLGSNPALDASLALRLERDFSLAHARFLLPGMAVGQGVSVPVPGAGSVRLAWEPRRLGSEMALLLAPLRVGASCLFLIGIGWVMLRLYRLATELEERRRAAQQLAVRDPLTGLGNRLAFDEGLEQLYRQRGAGALLYLDLDDFKSVNDNLGHGAGDELLRVLSARLSTFAGEGDVLVRIGGDEFGLLRTSKTTRAELAELARDIAISIREPVKIGANEITVGTCIGIALAPQHGGDAAKLVLAADGALYRAKAVGNGCFLFAGETGGELSLGAAAGVPADAGGTELHAGTASRAASG